MKYYIIKYATTSGVRILTEEEAQFDSRSPTVIKYGFYGRLHKPDWTTNAAEAREQINEMFSKKKRSLMRQLAKLEGKREEAVLKIDCAEMEALEERDAKEKT